MPTPKTATPEEFLITVRLHEGTPVLEGITGQQEIIKGVTLVGTVHGREIGEAFRTVWGTRGDPIEACRGMAHFLVSNPPLCDIVLAMIAIARSGRLDGEMPPDGPETTTGGGPA